jgi:glutamine amidotransferase
MQKIAIIDYNMGNLSSVKNAFLKLGCDVDIISTPESVKDYDKIVLPGVGAFGDAMVHLKEFEMDMAIKEFAKSGKPLLGICLGMQLLFDRSEEFGSHIGLGLIPGDIKYFDSSKFPKRLKIPHMGWNKLFIRKQTPLFAGLDESFYLYFVHSYHAVTNERYIIGKTLYGYEFASAVQKENVYGFQPHPEKSHDDGLKIIENFIKL